ncbi:MAG: hypothetical protein IPK31_12650 [Chitinophagaceae bacterium]|nr:hypothetical protein [Chitinophagaceae bacterium]
MKNFISTGVVILSIIISFSACKSEAGPAGATGATGATGPQGPAGVTGSANVIYSGWTTVTQAQWSGIGGAVINYNLSAPGLTTTIYNQGIILVYWEFAGTLYQLPFSFGVSEMSYSSVVGTIKMRYTTDAVISSFATTRFRYILVPGGVSGGRFTSGAAAGYTIEQIKAMSYTQVTELFKIPAEGSNEK